MLYVKEIYMDFIYLLLGVFSVSMLVSFFMIGYLLGKLSVSNGVSKCNKSFIKNDQKNTLGSIDDTKFVVKIKTDELQKKYDQLGDIKSSEENINNSVSKLKNMKG